MTDQAQGFEAHFHFLTPGCLGPYIDKFTAELASAGYTTLSIDNYQQSIAHFGTWLQHKGAGVGDINAKMLATFADHRCRCPGGRRHKKLSRKYVARVRRFVHYLNQWPRKVDTEVVTLTGQQLNWLLDGYDVMRLQPHERLHYSSVL